MIEYYAGFVYGTEQEIAQWESEHVNTKAVLEGTVKCPLNGTTGCCWPTCQYSKFTDDDRGFCQLLKKEAN
jgi:hypothetical protein